MELTSVQKDFIGSTATTHKGGVVTVTGYIGNGSYSSSCTLCCQDEELYPKNCFVTQKANWKKGSLPCACQPSYTPSDKQREVIYRRLCTEVGYTFKGIVKKGSSYHLKVSCSKCMPDEEIYPEGSLTTRPEDMRSGKIPCLCSKNPKLSPDKYLILHNRHLSIKFPNLKAVKNLGNNRYEYECSVCSKDQELWGKGSICSLKVVSSLPCGCSKSPRLTKEQYEILVLRRCRSLGYDFIGFADKYKGKGTKLKLHNPSSGNTWSSTRISTFLNGSIDPVVAVETKARNSLLSDYELTERLYSRFNYPKGTVFTRVGTSNTINVSCPICSEDKYSKNCEASSKFSALMGDLLLGKKCCRCSNYSFSLEDKTLQAKEYVNNLEGEYLGWVSGKEGEQVEWLCNNNHRNKTTMRVFRNGSGCLSCSKSGFNPEIPATLYIVEWYGYGQSFLKYGITNQEVIRRVRQQATKAQLDYNILYTFYNESGRKVSDVESEIKILYGSKGACPRQWFPDGFTETIDNTSENLDNLLHLASVLK